MAAPRPRKRESAAVAEGSARAGSTKKQRLAGGAVEGPKPDVALVFSKGGELLVHSQVLSLASPVFAAMLASDMQEGQGQRIEVAQFDKIDFEQFYEFLLPASSRCMKVSESNFEMLCALSDYYQVDALKCECAELLRTLDASIPCLLLAHRYGFEDIYAKFTKNLAHDIHKHDIGQLEGHSKVLMDLMTQVQKMHIVMDRLFAVGGGGFSFRKARRSEWSVLRHVRERLQQQQSSSSEDSSGSEDPE